MPTDRQHPPLDEAAVEDHDRGLAHDLAGFIDRRRALTLLGGAGMVAMATACGVGGDSSTDTTSSTTDTTTEDATSTSQQSTESGDSTTGTESSSCSEIPEETAGPFPGDGSNGPDVLAESGVVRSDITRSVGSASGTAEGVPLTVELTVVDTSNGCQPYAGAAIYLWHCDREGRYSMYDDGVEDENYLRGVQQAGDDGVVRFTTIVPGAYSGRWPHAHFEVYPSVDAATTASDRLRTSQLALPEDTCTEVYATDGYEQSVGNLQQTSLDSDMVFSDGYSLQMAKISGSIDDGLTARLTVPV